MAKKIIPKILVDPPRYNRGKQDISNWLSSWLSANSLNPKRVKLMDLYEMLMIDAHLYAIVTNRKNKVLGEKFLILDSEGNENVELSKLFDSRWFRKFCEYTLDAIFYGFSLIEISEITDTGLIADVNLVQRRNVLPEKNQVAISQNDMQGVSFSEGNYANYYVMVDTGDLGLLLNIAPNVIYKRFAMGDMSSFLEKFGKPLIALQSDNIDLNIMTDKAQQLGKDGAIGLSVNDKLSLLFPAGGDGANNYKTMIELCNQEISKAVHGQTMTSDNGASKAQGNVHENTAEEYQERDMEDVEDVVKAILFPKMVALGYPAELLDHYPKYQKLKNQSDSIKAEQAKKDADTLSIEFNRTLELIKTGLYNVPVADIFDKFGITVTEKAQATTKNSSKKLIGNSQKKKLKNQKLPTALLPNLNAVDNSLIDDAFAEITKQLQKIADFLFGGGNISDFMMEKIAVITSQLLIKAANLGIDYALDPNLIAALQANIFRFSSAKSYQQLLQMQKLLIDDQGNRRSLEDYKRELDKLNITYNRNHIATEYNLAIATGQIISRWSDLTNGNPDALITYDAVGDGLTTDLCNRLDRTCLPASDGFWGLYTPPNHFNCRSTIRRGTAINLPKDLPKVDANFAFNPATQGAIFASNYNYFNGFPDFANKSVLDKKGNLNSFDRETFDEKKNTSFEKFDIENLFGGFSKSAGGGATFFGKSASISDDEKKLRIVASIRDNENIIQIQSEINAQDNNNTAEILQFDFSKSNTKDMALIADLYKQLSNVNTTSINAIGSEIWAKFGFYCLDKKQVMAIVESAEKAKNKKAKALRKLVEDFYKDNENKPFPMKNIFDLGGNLLTFAEWDAFLDLTDAEAKKDFEQNINY